MAELLEAALSETRLPGRAGGRAHDRGRGPGREPRGAGRRRRRVRRQPRARGRGRGAAAGGVPAADLPLHRAGRPARGRVAGHADDAAQRQGARVRGGLHHRLRGGRLPAHARAGRGGRGGGAAPLLRRHHPRPAAPLHDLRPGTAAVRARRAQPALALPRRAAGGADRARGRPTGGAGRLGGGRRRPAPPSRSTRPDPGAADRRRRRPRQLRRGGRHRASSRAGSSSSASPATAPSAS